MKKKLNIIAVADLHNDKKSLREMKESYKDIDLLLIAGDLTNMGSMVEITVMLEFINDLDIPTILVFGNHDKTGEFTDYNHYKNITILHNNIVEFEGLKIFGTPYTSAFCNWGFQYYSEAQMQRYMPDGKVDIFLSHGGPTGAVSTMGNGNQIGSTAIYDYIKEYQPFLSISGHNHEGSGIIEEIGRTKVYNVAQKITKITLDLDIVK